MRASNGRTSLKPRSWRVFAAGSTTQFARHRLCRGSRAAACRRRSAVAPPPSPAPTPRVSVDGDGPVTQSPPVIVSRPLSPCALSLGRSWRVVSHGATLASAKRWISKCHWREYRTISCIRRTFLPQNLTSKEGVRLIHEYI